MAGVKCHNSALCIFDQQPVQTDVLKSYIMDFYPVNSLDGDGPIDFNVKGEADEYIDLNDINLNLHVKITKADGNKLAATDLTAFVNLPIASMFKDVVVNVNDTQIHGGEYHYPYTTYLQTVTQFQKQAQKTHMQLWGWERDESGKFDDNGNTGHVARQKYVAESDVYHLYGPLFVGIFQQERYLINNTPMKITLRRASPEFALFNSAGGAFKFTIEKAELHVRYATMNPSVIEGHTIGLEKKNALYPYLNSKLIVHTALKDCLEARRDYIFSEAMPRALMIAMVDHDAYSGNIKKNPFNFQHYNLQSLSLFRSGALVDNRPFEINYAEDYYADVYAYTMRSLKMYNKDDSNGLTLAEFKDGYNIYVFDLTPDNANDAPHRSISLDKGLRLEMKFSKKLPNNINILILGIFDEFMEISKLRRATTTANAS